MHRKQLLILFSLIAGFLACNKKDMDHFNGFERPPDFPEPADHFSTNEVAKNGFELARKLFYDLVLKLENNRGIALNADKKLKILTFLQTLHDSSFVTGQRFAEQ